MKITELNIDKSWTLFLDRDGVINRKLPDDYVCRWEQFEFNSGVLDSIALLSKLFNRIIIITNQQGIGKGLMTNEDLLEIHSKMLDEIKINNGRIDKIYYCPFKANEHSIMRKPGTGMALLAKKDFPDIVFKKSIMVGDGISDMIFGKNLNMVTVFISDDDNFINKNKHLINFSYFDLLSFSKELKI